MVVKTQGISEGIDLAVSARAGSVPPPPGWVGDLAARGDEFALTSVRIADAAEMDAETLERSVAEAYAEIAARVKGQRTNRLVRVWNHIPRLHERVDDRRDRYMVFNAGRYRAFAEWYGGLEAFDRDVATATGVGHDGRDLVIHALWASVAGLAVDNPRQVAPHRYSKRYGPLPPCFARATVLEDAGLILVGGTASIRGEDSLYAESLDLQMSETLTNLASVAEAAHARVRGAAGGRPREEWLGCYREVRVYHPRAQDAGALGQLLRDAFVPECRIEMMRADLCRGELLVEVEGLAEVGA